MKNCSFSTTSQKILNNTRFNNNSNKSYLDMAASQTSITQNELAEKITLDAIN